MAEFGEFCLLISSIQDAAVRSLHERTGCNVFVLWPTIPKVQVVMNEGRENTLKAISVNHELISDFQTIAEVVEWPDGRGAAGEQHLSTILFGNQNVPILHVGSLHAYDGYAFDCTQLHTSHADGFNGASDGDSSVIRPVDANYFRFGSEGDVDDSIVFFLCSASVSSFHIGRLQHCANGSWICPRQMCDGFAKNYTDLAALSYVDNPCAALTLRNVEREGDIDSCAYGVANVNQNKKQRVE